MHPRVSATTYGIGLFQKTCIHFILPSLTRRDALKLSAMRGDVPRGRTTMAGAGGAAEGSVGTRTGHPSPSRLPPAGAVLPVEGAVAGHQKARWASLGLCVRCCRTRGSPRGSVSSSPAPNPTPSCFPLEGPNLVELASALLGKRVAVSTPECGGGSRRGTSVGETIRRSSSEPDPGRDIHFEEENPVGSGRCHHSGDGRSGSASLGAVNQQRA